MKTSTPANLNVPAGLVDAIRAFPQERDIEHCGVRFSVAPFDFYASCPHCGIRIKVRAFSATPEIEDVFDAIFEWMQQPGAADLVKRRQESLKAEEGADE
jgi:hypothetical protein